VRHLLKIQRLHQIRLPFPDISREEQVKSVLVVDDEEMVREAISGILSLSGYDVIQAKDGLDGLLKYQASRAKIIMAIIDIKMPMMDGAMLSNVIKGADPLTKIILISGHVEQSPPEANADAFLLKPFLSKDLLALILQVLAA
jgi:CheY-like chemotaxis protein